MSSCFDPDAKTDYSCTYQPCWQTVTITASSLPQLPSLVQPLYCRPGTRRNTLQTWLSSPKGTLQLYKEHHFIYSFLWAKWLHFCKPHCETMRELSQNKLRRSPWIWLPYSSKINHCFQLNMVKGTTFLSALLGYYGVIIVVQIWMDTWRLNKICKTFILLPKIRGRRQF